MIPPAQLVRRGVLISPPPRENRAPSPGSAQSPSGQPQQGRQGPGKCRSCGHRSIRNRLCRVSPGSTLLEHHARPLVPAVRLLGEGEEMVGLRFSKGALQAEWGTVESFTPPRRTQPDAGRRRPHPRHSVRSTHLSTPLGAEIPPGAGDQVSPIPGLARGIRRALPWATTGSSDPAEYANKVACSSPTDSFEELSSSSRLLPQSGRYPQTKVHLCLETLSHATRPRGATQWQIPGIHKGSGGPCRAGGHAHPIRGMSWVQVLPCTQCAGAEDPPPRVTVRSASPSRRLPGRAGPGAPVRFHQGATPWPSGVSGRESRGRPSPTFLGGWTLLPDPRCHDRSNAE